MPRRKKGTLFMAATPEDLEYPDSLEDKAAFAGSPAEARNKYIERNDALADVEKLELHVFELVLEGRYEVEERVEIKTTRLVGG